ncbi:MAG: glycosyltransferase [Burkholderiaceae bacterium]
MHPPTVAYLLSAYPDFHETFVAREVEAIRQLGIDLRIYSLKPPPSGAYLYAEHARLVRYLPFLFDSRVLGSLARCLVRRPLRLVKALGWVISTCWRRPAEFAKTLAILPKTLAIADELDGSKIALHAHWATIPTSAAVLIQIVSGRPFSITAHAWDIYLPSRAELQDKIRRSCGLVTCTGYNVGFLRDLAGPENAHKVNLNYHGIDLSRITQTTRVREVGQPLKVVAVGRLVEQKGFRDMVEAVAIATRAGRMIEVTLIGDGPLEAQLKQLAAAHGVTDRIAFAGRVGHAQTIATMCAADLLIAPSVIAKNGDRDGIPNVVLEAMACGLPIIGTSVSGIPEVVRSGATGVLVAPADVQALAQALATLFDDPAHARLCGGRAREFIEQNFMVAKNVCDLAGHLGRFHNYR